MEKNNTSAIRLDLRRVEIFQTNVEGKKEADQLIKKLSRKFPRFDIHFDLEDCDHILRVEGQNVLNEQIVSLMSAYGYQCKTLE